MQQQQQQGGAPAGGPPMPQQGGQQQGPATWRTWHSNDDVPQRRQLIQQILRLFQQRKPSVTKEWQQKLPDFVRRLEEALYRTARSKEDYADLSTLEQRLQAVARRMVARGPGQGGSQTQMMAQAAAGVSNTMGMPPSSGSPIANPGMSGQSQGMLPTPGMSQGVSSMPGGQQNPMSMPMPVGSQQMAGNPGVKMEHMGMRQQMHPGGAPMQQQQQQMMRQQQQVKNEGSMGMSGMQMPSGPSGPGVMPTPGGQQTNGGMQGAMQNGVMSNGAPVMMRGGGGRYPISPTVQSGSGRMMPVPGMGDGTMPTPGQPQMMPTPGQAQQQQPPQQGGMVMMPTPGVQQQGGPQTMPTSGGQSMQQQGRGGQPGPGGAGGGPGMPGFGGLPGPGGAGGVRSGGMMGAPGAGGGAGGPGQYNSQEQRRQYYEQQKAYILKQQRWLLFLRHASKCQAPEGQCTATPHCHVARKLWQHVLSCSDAQCQYPRCVASRELLKHHQRCKEPSCPVCGPVKETLSRQRVSSMGGQPGGQPGAQRGAQQRPGMQMQRGPPNQQQPPTKRQRSSSQKDMVGAAGGQMVQGGGMMAGQQRQVGPDGMLLPPQGTKGRQGTHMDEGTSLIETFLADMIRQHLASLRAGTAGTLGTPHSARRAAADGERLLQNASENACRACAAERLTFEPMPLYCNVCSVRIKRNQVYYMTTAASVKAVGQEVKYHWCKPCYDDYKTNVIEIDGHNVPRDTLEKRKNDEEVEEGWVQCDKCNTWQHQICALFNSGQNRGGGGRFICPQCLLDMLERGERSVTTKRTQAMLGAADLPRTKLSDFLEARMGRSLSRELAERARQQGKKPEEVPQVEPLVIRVVSCTDKKLEVKANFYEQFQGVNYPAEYTYRSKVLLMFQKIEGVDVCIFGMYTQEFGADAPAPNTRRVYLSYLDSVKYFRPEVPCAYGYALRTFVYHDILVGYLQYLKQRGFTSIYIWACPPMHGDDYILYCHPKTQKVPRSDKLREWYLRMLRSAMEERIVVHLGNMYDTFFTENENGDQPSAANLPYFDGDYWPGAAEDMLSQIDSEMREAKKKSKAGGKSKGPASKGGRAKMTRNGSGSSVPESADQALMEKLGEAIKPMKEDFIMVHLHNVCSHCGQYIQGAMRYYCEKSAHFELCSSCYAYETLKDDKDRHPKGVKVVYELKSEMLPELPDTKDPDEVIESEFFDTRQAFLSLCQGNHYQFDTARRAKHSSMMVLYHLHNPTAPAFVCTCNVCATEIEPGKGWRCETCPDYDLCDACHSNPKVRHPHQLHRTTQDGSGGGHMQGQLSEAQRQARQQQLQRTMELLVHASACSDRNCPSTNCRKVKALFQHGLTCKTKATNGCNLCRRMWALLQIHAKTCRQSNCPVPRCHDLKEYRRRAQQQMEDRRRQQYMAMARQGPSAD